MKKYRLKKWYPSLNRRIEKGDIATWDGQHYRIVKEYQQYEDCGLTEGWYHFVKEEVENNPDFWELIEEEKPKPLFITEDRVEVFDGDEYIAIGYDFNKINMIARNIIDPYLSGAIKFKHEANADEYIWRNKRVFSYEDIMDNIYMQIEEDVFQQLAKKRSEE